MTTEKTNADLHIQGESNEEVRATLDAVLPLAYARFRPRLFAAIGSDGTRSVVWGLGESEEEARRDGRRWLAHSNAEHEADDLQIVPVSDAAARDIHFGAVGVGPKEDLIVVDGALIANERAR